MRLSCVREPLDLGPQRDPRLRVEPRRRLVEEEHARPVDEADRNVEPPLHPTGVAARDAVGGLAQADELEQFVDAGAQGRAGHAVDPALEHEVLAPGRLPVHAGLLCDVPDRAAHAVRVANDVFAGDDRASGVGSRQRRERAHGRRLAGAVRAEQSEHLAVADGERDAVERLDLLVALAEVFGDDRVHALTVLMQTRLLCNLVAASGLGDANAGPDAGNRADRAEQERHRRERARAPEHRHVPADDAAESSAEADHGTSHVAVDRHASRRSLESAAVDSGIRARSSSAASASPSAAASPEEARAAASSLGGPVVVKAQVLTGGRGKAGGVKLAEDPADAEQKARDILGLDIRGHIVRKLWIERASDIAKEYYLSITFDRRREKAALHVHDAGWRRDRAGR